jgi:phage shock protein E
MNRGRILRIFLVLLLIVLFAFLLYNTASPLALYPDKAKALLKDGAFDHVVDVRTKREWDMGRFPLAIHIPMNVFEEQLPLRIPDKNAKILFYCNTSTRSRVAAETAEKMGYKNINYLVGSHRNIM